MELLVILSPILLLALIISISLNSYKHKSKPINGDANLPPGKMGWPFIGESLELLKNGRDGVPEKFIKDRMQKFSSKVFMTSLFGETTAVFCGALGNKFLFTNENKLVNVWWPHSIEKIFRSSIQTDGREDEARMRKFLLNFLKIEALQRNIGSMDALAKRHLESEWDNKKEVTVYPLVKNFAFEFACMLFLSINDPDQLKRLLDPFGTVLMGIVSIPIDLPGTRFNRAIKASELIRKELHAIIKQRKIDLAEKKASPTQDILSHMLTTSNENGVFMNEMDIAKKILGFLIGGHETSSATITFIVKYLAEFPHVYDGVLKEQTEIAKSKGPGELLNWDDVKKMKYSWNVACEVLRLAPPVQGTFREAISDFTYAGFFIPKGLKLYWSPNSTHKNPEYFPEPEKFDPSRFEGNGPAPYTYVPFGGGVRMCPGKEYSRLEILVFMHNLVRKYKWEKLLPDEKIIVDPIPIPANGLPVRLQPRTTH